MGAKLIYNPLPWWEYGENPSKETLDFCNKRNYTYERAYRKITSYKEASESKEECLKTCHIPYERKQFIGESEYYQEEKEMNEIRKLVNEYWEKLILC